MGEVMSEKLEKNLEQTASKKMRLLKLFLVYSISECLYIWWWLCHRVINEKEICG